MDLGTIMRKLYRNKYQLPEDCAGDVRVMFNNCLKYNGASGGDISVMVKKLRSTFDNVW